MRSQLHFSQAAQAELNAFLAQHRVVSVEKQWLNAGVESHWAVCVSVAEGSGPLPEAGKVDYREVLDEADFAVFAELRVLRKTLAEAEGVPPYAVFTNEQLADLGRRRVTSAQARRRRRVAGGQIRARLPAAVARGFRRWTGGSHAMSRSHGGIVTCSAGLQPAWVL